MFIFLLSAIPLLSVCALSWSGPRFSYKKDLFHMTFGVLAGIVYSGVGALFIRAYRLSPDSFGINWGFFFLTRTLLPLVYLTVLFVLLSRGSLRERFYSLPLYIAGFYMIFMPYQVIHSNDGFDFFLLFIWPLITACMLLLLWYSCTLFSKGIGVVTVYGFLVLLPALLMPSLLLTLYYLNRLLWLRIFAGVLFGAFSIYTAILSFPLKER